MRLLSTGATALLLAAGAHADPREDLARIDVRNLTIAAKTYNLKRGNFPEKLVDLKTAGYVDPKATLLDPWGNPYQYDPKGNKNGGKQPDIWAVTPDKRQIGNWPEQKDR